MCTVTFIPSNKTDFILTSNRDESPNRLSSSPDFDEINNTKILYPKDKMSGGTWIGASEKNRVLCILNGGFGWHERRSDYRMSRGIIVKELLVCDDLEASIATCNLQDIEPFTLVIIDWIDKLRCFELIWDGDAKHFNEMPLKPLIWSSSTLFSESMKSERMIWFNTFKAAHELNANSIMKFHRTAGIGNQDYGVIMDRGFVKTTSITQIIKNNNILGMQFFDLVNHKESSNSLTTLQLLNE